MNHEFLDPLSQDTRERKDQGHEVLQEHQKVVNETT